MAQQTSNAAHTPGPWTLAHGWNGLIHIYKQETDASGQQTGRARYLATVAKESIETVAEQTANANLIAAAPDLLEALIDLLDFRTSEQGMSHTRYRALCQQHEDAARAAIAKATGGEQP